MKVLSTICPYEVRPYPVFWDVLYVPMKIVKCFYLFFIVKIHNLPELD